MRVYRYHKSGGKGRKALTGILVTVFILGSSFGLATLWQSMQEGSGAVPAVDPEPPAAQMEESSELSASAAAVGFPDTTPEASGSAPDPGEDLEESQVEEAEEQAADSAEALGYAREAISGSVPPSAKVENAYFEDAIFFGDSISTGIPLYQVAGSPDTIAVKGANPLSINTDALVTTPGGESKTFLDAALDYGEKNKVYIMMGSNGLWMDEDSFIQGYSTFLDGVMAQYPGAVIYLQSMPPVTVNAKQIYPTADNQVINTFNDAIAVLARNKGVYFVDVAQALVDEEGNLPLEASPTDGMHLTPEYYLKWFDYLKTHTVSRD